MFDLQVDVQVARRPASALLLPGDAALGFAYGDGRVRVRAPRLDTYALVAIQP